MKLSDFIIDFFAKQGVGHAFLVSGGAVIHLVDSANRHPNMECVCVQHEQNGAAAADMYARATGKVGLALSTSGPGASNMTTSICNAFFDSVPLICVTGQVTRARLRKTEKLRQRGFQETDVVSIFKSITKYAVLVTDPSKILYELQKAVYLATHERPGPVVIDIPDDLQREEIDPSALQEFTPPHQKPRDLHSEVTALFSLLEKASRPVVVLGAGIHAAKVECQAVDFVEKNGLPCALTWGGADLLTDDHPLNVGRVGVCGPRGGNFALQNADLIIALGTRLSQMITGGKQNLFAPHAKKVMVDIDPYELSKFDEETFILDLPICSELSDFFDAALKNKTSFEFEPWRDLSSKWRQEFDHEALDTSSNREVNPHHFVQQLSHHAPEKSIIIGDTGANLAWTCQSWKFKKGQRIHSAWNHTPMGFALPAAVGAAFANQDDAIFCLIGDGGLMMCLQELATIERYNLPVYIFLFNNAGHSIQKQTMETWLDGRLVAADHKSGLCFPNYEKLADAFRLNYFSITTNDEVAQIPEIMKKKAPFFCNVVIDSTERITPMLKFGSGLEDLNPALPLAVKQKIEQEALSLNLIESGKN